MRKSKKVEFVDGGYCYFCKADLRRVDRKKKIQLECCGIFVHRREIYSWFLKNQHCPSCLSVNQKTRQKIVEWGMNKEKAKIKQPKVKSIGYKPKKFDKRLAKSYKKKNF